jgi:plastocyanin
MWRRFAFAVLLLAATVARGQSVEITVSVHDEQGRAVEDAVVVAVPADGNLRPPPRVRENVIDQVNKQFLPHVQAVLVGTAVSFPNNDSVRHHVYSFSPAKRFELPLYAGVPAQPIVFDKPGIVVLGCNIHDWMLGYIYVSESPYFAKTDKDGKALLPDLPPRRYLIRVWHPQLKAAEESTQKEVDTSKARRSDVEWKLALKPEARVRRAPTGEPTGHY